MTNSSSPYDRNRQMLDENVEALATFVRTRIEAGWKPSLLTLSFTPLPGKPAAVLARMTDATDRLYRTLVTNVVRRPASASSRNALPIMIAAPDLPVPKRDKVVVPVSFNNGGMHVHGVLLIPPRSRLREPVEEHFARSAALYVRPPLLTLDARPVTTTPERVVEYALKSIRRGRFGFDDLLILPRARAEIG